MGTGTVKWFNDSKGFGFITRRRRQGSLRAFFGDSRRRSQEFAGKPESVLRRDDRSEGRSGVEHQIGRLIGFKAAKSPGNRALRVRDRTLIPSLG